MPILFAGMVMMFAGMACRNAYPVYLQFYHVAMQTRVHIIMQNSGISFSYIAAMHWC